MFLPSSVWLYTENINGNTMSLIAGNLPSVNSSSYKYKEGLAARLVLRVLAALLVAVI